MSNRKGFEFSFTWMFSILVGAAVIALAIYGVSKLIGSERNIQDTESAQQLQIIFNPLHTSVESGTRPRDLTFSSESRLSVSCNSNKQPYGEERISIASRSALGRPWQDSGLENAIRAQYIFSEKIVQGKKMNVLVQPFLFPYKVADVITLWSGSYCFVNPENEIEETLGSTGLNVSNVEIVNALSKCRLNSTRVCFSGVGSGESISGCDVIVNSALKQVKKKGKIMYYEGSLVYGAIFSDPEIYECNVKRLMMRTSKLAEIYTKKSQVISYVSGCGSGVGELVSIYKTQVQINNSRELSRIQLSATQMAREQQSVLCSLWKERYL